MGRGFWLLILFGTLVVVVGVTLYSQWQMSGRPATNGIANKAPAVTTNTNPTKKVNQPANVNITNAAKPLNANTTKVSYTTVGFDLVVAEPTTYTGKNICLGGDFLAANGAAAFGSILSADVTGQPILEGSRVLVVGSVPTTGLTCTGTGATAVCSGSISLCGRFDYAAPGQPGYGSMSDRYRLTLTK